MELNESLDGMLATACRRLAEACAICRQENASGRKHWFGLCGYSAGMELRISLKSRGFTLVELLVVIAIIAILAGLLMPTLARCQRRAKQVNEFTAAKQLVLAWQLYADEHEDFVLPGYSSQVEA